MKSINRLIVSAVVLSSDQHVLFGKKSAKRGGVYLDKWHIPGGGVEADESQLAALARELKEETGIELEKAQSVMLVDDLGGTTTPKKLPNGETVMCKMQFFVYRVVLTERASQVAMAAGDDFEELKWIAVTELANYPHTPPSLSLFLRLGWLTADQALAQRDFVNANLEPVAYDGSGITWRISAYILVVKDDALLVAKSKHENFFDVIGGGVDLGENIEDALYREALEEAGVHIKVKKLLFTSVDWFYHRKGNFHQTLQLYYEAEVVGEPGKPTDPEIETAQFVQISEIGVSCQLAASPNVVTLIREYLQKFE